MRKHMKLTGNPVSKGIVIGSVYRYEKARPSYGATDGGYAGPELEQQKWERARRAAEGELRDIAESMRASGDDKAEIFQAHLEILGDEVMEEEIEDAISGGKQAGEAVSATYDAYYALLAAMEDALIRERADDIRDVKERLLRCLAGGQLLDLSHLPGPVVVAAEDLLPSDTATLDRAHVLAILTQTGGSTSHSAIIARSYEIPAILGIPELMSRLEDGQTVAVDAVRGEVWTDPSPRELSHFSKLSLEYGRQLAETKAFQTAEPVTRDGCRIEVEANIAAASDQELRSAAYVDGVGLFRTEFLYMGRPDLPTEEEQLRVYRKVLTAFGSKPVTLRTLDIGGDKQLSCMELPKEDNPFLGNRALRLCLSHPDMFMTQLRAALRASVYGNLRIMFPMVSSIEDIRAARSYLEKAKEELRREGTAFDEAIRTGIMVEIPSIALISDLAAREVDFISIGSNDLCQYLTAADRMNPEVAPYYRSFHPAMFRLIGKITGDFRAAGKDVGVCGEMGGNPLSALALIGLGVNRLSMGEASVPGIKRMICSARLEDAKIAAAKICAMPCASQIEETLQACLDTNNQPSGGLDS